MIKKILIAVAAVIVVVLAFKYCEFKDSDDRTTIEETALIQQQLQNVGKLVVTEGHYSEVMTYTDKNGYLPHISLFDNFNEKKALVIINADATVSYDLRQVQYDINEATKTITIKNIPKEEIKISPEIKFYDVQQSTMNEFTGEDYNKINAKVKASLRKKIENSTLKTNAQNRLLSELSKILILTNTMGWTLQYNGEQVETKNLETLL